MRDITSNTDAVRAVRAVYLLDGEYEISGRDYGVLLMAYHAPATENWYVHAEYSDGECRLYFMLEDDADDYSQSGGMWGYRPVGDLLAEIEITEEEQ